MHLPTVISILGATIELPVPEAPVRRGPREGARRHRRRGHGRRAVHTVGPDDTVETAATAMHEHDVSRLPVVDGDGHLVGHHRPRRHPPGDRPGRPVGAARAVRPTRVEIDLDAVRHNVASARRPRRARRGAARWSRPRATATAPSEVARAALEAGATRLGVALTEEGAALRAAGIDAPDPAALRAPRVVAPTRSRRSTSTATVYTAAGCGPAVGGRGGRTRARSLGVHLKVDTGMHRVGAAPADARDAGPADRRPPRARARGRVHPLRGGRRARRPVHRRAARPVRGGAGRASRPTGIDPACVHAANSAGGHRPPGQPATTWCAAASPSTGSIRARRWPGPAPLRPALRLVSAVSFVKRVPAGDAGRPTASATECRRRHGAGHGAHRVRRRRAPPAAARSAARCSSAGRRLPDRRHGHHGPDRGRLRARRRGRGRRRGGAHRAAGRRVDRGRGLGASASSTIGYEIVTRVGPRVRREYR